MHPGIMWHRGIGRGVMTVTRLVSDSVKLHMRCWAVEKKTKKKSMFPCLLPPNPASQCGWVGGWVGGWVVGAAWPVGLQGGGEVGVMTMAATHFVVLGPSHIGSMVVVVVVVVVVLGPPPWDPSPGTPPNQY